MKHRLVWPLLVVALLALGTFSVIGLQGDVSGALVPPKPPLKPKPVIIDRGPVVIEEQPETVVYADQSARDNILLTCYVFQYEHPEKAPPNIAKICSA